MYFIVVAFGVVAVVVVVVVDADVVVVFVADVVGVCVCVCVFFCKFVSACTCGWAFRALNQFGIFCFVFFFLFEIHSISLVRAVSDSARSAFVSVCLCLFVVLLQAAAVTYQCVVCCVLCGVCCVVCVCCVCVCVEWGGCVCSCVSGIEIACPFFQLLFFFFSF